MSEIALTKELLSGCFAFFVESGTIVDGITVSELAKPDNDPIDNWPMFRSVENMKPGKKLKDLGPRIEPSVAARGYTEKERKVVTERYLDLTLNDTNELVQRLEHGLASPIVPGTPQTPGADTKGEIYGWLKLQNMDLPAGVDHNVMDHWGYFTLEQDPAVENKFQQPVLRFHRVTGSAFNSINFPIAA